MTQSPEPQRIRPRRTRIAAPPWAPYALMALFVVGVVALGYFVFSGVKEFVATGPWGSGAPQGPIFGPGGETAATQTAQSGAVPAAWSGGRVAVLLMGIDEREYQEGPWRTDTMIILVLDPVTQRGGMLSLPRDLWVEIPGYGAYDRINTAHFRGDVDQYPGGGGPALAMATTQQNLGIPIGYYVRVNFNAFVQVVNTMGCIPIHVPETIDDPNYPAAQGYGFEPFHIDAGDHCMDGDTLLKYARTRATFGSDFDRAARQQDVIYAMRDHVLSTQQLPSLLAQAPQIYATVQGGVATNLSLEQMMAMAQAAAEIPRENICSAVINGEYIQGLETLADGSQVLIPDWDKIHQMVLDVYNGTGRCAPGAEDLAAQAAAEHATVSILNGTAREGLATETGDLLAAYGINIVSLGNADRFDYTQTIIVSYTGKDYTARYLAELLNLPETAIIVGANPGGEWDIQVILGNDYGG